MVGTRKHDPLDTGKPRALPEVDRTGDIGVEDLGPGPFQRPATEMQDRIDAFAEPLGRLGIGEVAANDLLARLGRRHLIAVGQPQHRKGSA